MSPYVVAIIQARLTSTRLPGKVMQIVCGKSLLELQIERMRRCETLDRIVLAIPDNPANLPLVDLCRKMAVDCFLGSETDVLDRYLKAAICHKADVVVRVTADCPLIDPVVVDSVVGVARDRYPHVDYVSNCHPRSFPRGLDCEVLTFETLKQVAALAHEDADREHVTRYVSMHMQDFVTESVLALHGNFSHHRWTVDVPEDLILIKSVFEELYPSQPQFLMADVLKAFGRHPEWLAINAHVEQKTS